MNGPTPRANIRPHEIADLLEEIKKGIPDWQTRDSVSLLLRQARQRRDPQGYMAAAGEFLKEREGVLGENFNPAKALHLAVVGLSKFPRSTTQLIFLKRSLEKLGHMAQVLKVLDLAAKADQIGEWAKRERQRLSPTPDMPARAGGSSFFRSLNFETSSRAFRGHPYDSGLCVEKLRERPRQD